MSRFPLHHTCGAVVTEEVWPTLGSAFFWVFDDLGVVLENRLCPGGCGSHLAVQISGPDMLGDNATLKVEA